MSKYASPKKRFLGGIPSNPSASLSLKSKELKDLMGLAYNLCQSLLPCGPSISLKIKSCSTTNESKAKPISQISIKKECLRCNTFYSDQHNSPTACSFHGHTTGEKGLFSLAPPHQGIDGEWNEGSGVIVYKWNEKNNRPNTGRANWKKRWNCCAEHDEKAPPCRRGSHVSYDDGFTLY